MQATALRAFLITATATTAFLCVLAVPASARAQGVLQRRPARARPRRGGLPG